REIRESRYPEGLPTGDAVATTAGEMDASYVIHTVGPVYRSCGSACETLLASCYSNALRVAEELGCKDIAFPAISTGIYGYPKESAARIAYRSVKQFLEEGDKLTVYFVFHNDEDKRVFEESIRGI
ncbi:MAG: macro domain-containing protein, partial [Sulfurovum sp.]